DFADDGPGQVERYLSPRLVEHDLALEDRDVDGLDAGVVVRLGRVAEDGEVPAGLTPRQGESGQQEGQGGVVAADRHVSSPISAAGRGRTAATAAGSPGRSAAGPPRPGSPRPPPARRPTFCPTSGPD